MNDRQLPPQSIEAEMSILGGILIDNGAIDIVHRIITTEDFYRESHRQIFTAMDDLTDRNEPVDIVTLSVVLKSAGKLEAVGGGAYLQTLVEYVPTSANIAYYCKTVAARAAERRLILNAQAAIGIIYDGGAIVDAVSKLEAAIQPVVRHNSEPVGMTQSCRELVKKIEHRSENRGKIQGIPYGIEELDAATSGMHRGELIIIAGRPSMGKSALAGNILDSVCSSGGTGQLYSMEMPRADIMDRLAAGKGIKYQNIRNGHLQDVEWAKLTKAISDIHNWKLFIDDTPAISLRDLRTKARRQKRDGLDLLLVDYLQLMALPGKENRTQEIGQISRGLKQLARELDVPVIALSQLSRSVDSRPDKRPLMSDLRDSGEIEQDGDVVIFPFRAAAYCQKCKDRVNDSTHNYREHQAKAEIIIEKQRAGERNISIPVCWMGEYQKFVSI